MPRLTPARTVASAVALCLSLAAASCGGDDSVAVPPGCAEVAKPPPKQVDLAAPRHRLPRGEKVAATVETSCGSFEIALDANSPKTVISFAYQARKGVYDDTTFHRIVPDFVIQGGDPGGDGSGGPGYSVDEPPPLGTVYRKRTVAMAKLAVEPAGRSGSQFFVVTATDAGLPPQYALLGRVSSGWDVVRRIDELGDPGSGKRGTPRATVVIRRITIARR